MNNPTSLTNHNPPIPSTQTVRGLNSLLFFISDVRHGVGPLLAIYLRSTLKWNPIQVGIALAMADISSALSQVPTRLLVDATHYKWALIAFSCFCIIASCFLILSYPSFTTVILYHFQKIAS